jgi:hypothetical protein
MIATRCELCGTRPTAGRDGTAIGWVAEERDDARSYGARVVELRQIDISGETLAVIEIVAAGYGTIEERRRLAAELVERLNCGS